MTSLAYIHMDVQELDIDFLSDELQQKIDQGLTELTEEIEFELRRVAATSLDSSRDKYLRGITVDKQGNEITISLSGWVAVAIETGAPGFDLKPGFLKTRPYRYIPFIGYKKARLPGATVSWTRPGWWHPGLQARSLTSQVQDKVEKELVPQIFDRIIGSLKI